MNLHHIKLVILTPSSRCWCTQSHRKLSMWIPQSHQKLKLNMLMLSITPQNANSAWWMMISITWHIHALAQTSWGPIFFLLDIRENSMLSSGTFIFQLIVEWPLEKSHCYKAIYFKKLSKKKNVSQSKAATRLCSTWNTFHLGLWFWPYEWPVATY